MKLTCDCCGFEHVFADAEEAFQAGWDTPPHFSGYIACNLCPASYIVLGQTKKHAVIHAQWKRDGRPAEFSQETCVAEEDRVPSDALEAMKTDPWREIRRLLGQ